jgi:hypothetical protein
MSQRANADGTSSSSEYFPARMKSFGAVEGESELAILVPL